LTTRMPSHKNKKHSSQKHIKKALLRTLWAELQWKGQTPLTLWSEFIPQSERVRLGEVRSIVAEDRVEVGWGGNRRGSGKEKGWFEKRSGMVVGMGEEVGGGVNVEENEKRGEEC